MPRGDATSDSRRFAKRALQTQRCAEEGSGFAEESLLSVPGRTPQLRSLRPSRVWPLASDRVVQTEQHGAESGVQKVFAHYLRRTRTTLPRFVLKTKTGASVVADLEGRLTWQLYRLSRALRLRRKAFASCAEEPARPPHSHGLFRYSHPKRGSSLAGLFTFTSVCALSPAADVRRRSTAGSC